MNLRNRQSKVFISISLIASMLMTIGQFSFGFALALDKNLKVVNFNKLATKKVSIKGKAGRDYAAGELVIKFKSSANINSANKLANAHTLKFLKDKKVQLVKVDNQTDLLSAIEKYKNNPDVEYVQPNYLAKAYFTPNDARYNEQWSLTKMQVPAAWDITQGVSDVTVAVVDSGVDLDHPDLVGNLVTGTDIVDLNTPPDDENGHGTHLAGIIAAVTNNSMGVSGLASGAKIMPVRVLGTDGYGWEFDIYYGIKWAVDHGAKIINLSLGSETSDPLIADVINYAYEKGVIVVAAAGNENTKVSYPAAYNHVIGVAATNRYDQRASFSNYGPEIDVAAPGVNILSTTPNTKVDPELYLNYDYLTGTSMAAPQVAGLVALILSKNHDLNPDQVENIIKFSADDLGTTGFDNYFGYGRINALKALTFTSSITDKTAPTGFFKINNGAATTTSSTVTLSLNATDDSGKVTRMQFSNDGIKWSQWEPYALTYNWSLGTVDGNKKVYVKFMDGAGNQSNSLSELIILDTKKPIVKMTVPSYSNLVSQTTSFKIYWSADDGVNSSGMRYYDIDYIEGGTTNWISWKSNFIGTSADFKGVPGKTYYFRGRAKDIAGNIGEWTTINYATIVPYDNDSMISGRVGFNYTYSNSKSQNYLGTYRYSSKANEVISYKFVGDKVAVIGFKGQGQSKGKIYVDNVYKGTIDEYSSDAKYRQVIYSTYWSTKGTHIIKIVNLGTPGRRNFIIDGVAVGS